MEMILTSETRTIDTFDSDLSYSKLLALGNLSNPSYFAKKNHSSTGLHSSDPSNSCEGNTLDVLIMFVDTVYCSGILVVHVHEMCGLSVY